MRARPARTGSRPVVALGARRLPCSIAGREEVPPPAIAALIKEAQAGLTGTSDTTSSAPRAQDARRWTTDRTMTDVASSVYWLMDHVNGTVAVRPWSALVADASSSAVTT